MIYSYVLFPNHTEGLKLETVLKSNKVPYTITPAPRELSTCCGITLRISPEDENKVKGLIKENKITVDKIEKLEVKSYFNL